MLYRLQCTGGMKSPKLNWAKPFFIHISLLKQWKKDSAWLSLVISLGHCTEACRPFCLEPSKSPFILSGVCSPSRQIIVQILLKFFKSLRVLKSSDHNAFWVKKSIEHYYNCNMFFGNKIIHFYETVPTSLNNPISLVENVRKTVELKYLCC